MINFVYFGCGRVGSIPKASINDLVPFTDDNVKILKLDKIKSAKLKNALKVAKDYMFPSTRNFNRPLVVK